MNHTVLDMLLLLAVRLKLLAGSRSRGRSLALATRIDVRGARARLLASGVGRTAVALLALRIEVLPNPRTLASISLLVRLELERLITLQQIVKLSPMSKRSE